LHERTVEGTLSWSAKKHGQIVSDLIASLTEDRAIPHLAFGTGASLGTDIDKQISWGDMGEVVRALLSSSHLGMRARFVPSPLYEEDFSRTWRDTFERAPGPLGSSWSVLSGTISIVGGEAKATSTFGGVARFAAAGVLSHQVVRADRAQGSGSLVIAGPVARLQDKDNYYYTEANGTNIVLQKRYGGTTTTLASSPHAGYPVSLTIEADGSTLRVYKNDGATPIITHEDTTFTTGYAGFVCLFVNGYVSRFSVMSEDLPEGATDPRTIYIDVIEPVESDSKYGERYGNAVSDRALVDKTEWRNYAIVLGEGEGDARERVDVDFTSGSPRRELYVDARDLQRTIDEVEMPLADYQALLAQRGAEKLADTRLIEHAEAQITNGDAEVGEVAWYDSERWSAYLMVTEVETIYESGTAIARAVLGEPAQTLRKTIRKAL
jgi:hypothetical protein